MKIKNLNPLYEYEENSNRFSYHVKQIAKVPLRMARNTHEEFGPNINVSRKKGAISALGPLGAVIAKTTDNINIKRNSDPVFNRKMSKQKFNQVSGYDHNASIII